MTRHLLAALTVLTYGPQPRDLTCSVCGFHYQETAGHHCTPC